MLGSVMPRPEITIDARDMQALIDSDPMVSLKLLNTTMIRLLGERDAEIIELKKQLGSVSQENGSDPDPSRLQATVEVAPSAETRN